jgi:hypothetical protein
VIFTPKASILTFNDKTAVMKLFFVKPGFCAVALGNVSMLLQFREKSYFKQNIKNEKIVSI